MSGSRAIRKLANANADMLRVSDEVALLSHSPIPYGLDGEPISF
jgi:hypothetical protein